MSWPKPSALIGSLIVLWLYLHHRSKHQQWRVRNPRNCHSCKSLRLPCHSQGHRCHQSRTCHPAAREWLTNLLPGTLLAAVGLALFAFVETEDNYKYIHSAWHIVISLSISFLLPKRNASKLAQCKGSCGAAVIGGNTMQSIYDQVQPVLNNDSELVDIADYRLDSDLTSLIRGLHP